MNEKERIHERIENASTEAAVIYTGGNPSVVGYPESVIDLLPHIRGELSRIDVNPDNDDDQHPIVITSEPAVAGGPLGILQEKQMKRTQKERRESQPRQYSEMLVVANDMQLLRETDQEALGAFMKYIEANKGRITHLVLNGDIADFSAQSFFEKDLETMNSAGDEIEAVKWLIETFNKLLPNTKKVFIDGNHEARWTNMIDNAKGNEAWIKSIDEQFGLDGWEHLTYGSGAVYRWHDRIFWHGHRTSIHTAKAELLDAGMSVTTAHINRNQYFEQTDAMGNRKSGIAHGGFSKDNLGFMKKAVTNWAQGFGVYYYDTKSKTETPYMVTMTHRQPRFIGPDGVLYDGKGFEIPGFEKPKRGRPRK